MAKRWCLYSFQKQVESAEYNLQLKFAFRFFPHYQILLYLRVEISVLLKPFRAAVDKTEGRTKLSSADGFFGCAKRERIVQDMRRHRRPDNNRGPCRSNFVHFPQRLWNSRRRPWKCPSYLGHFSEPFSPPQLWFSSPPTGRLWFTGQRTATAVVNRQKDRAPGTAKTPLCNTGGFPSSVRYCWHGLARQPDVGELGKDCRSLSFVLVQKVGNTRGTFPSNHFSVARVELGLGHRVEIFLRGCTHHGRHSRNYLPPGHRSVLWDLGQGR